MAKFNMEEWEILEDYRLAKNKREQIGILADRNCCKKSDIIVFLQSHGETVKCPYRHTRIKSSECNVLIEALVHYKNSIINEMKVIANASELLEKKLESITANIEVLRQELNKENEIKE